MTLDEAIIHCEEVADRCAVTDGNRECEAKYGKLLKQQPCEDAISRQAVIDLLKNTNNGWIINKVLQLPPVTPQPKMGHWVFVDKAKEHAHCSECDYGNVDLLDGRPHNYCPQCGIKMMDMVMLL